TITYEQISTDTLISIENVNGTAGPDTITGNEFANVLDGRDGNDTLDGGFGDDTLIGGAGIDTASFVSHDAITSVVEVDTITLGLNGATGQATRSVFSSNGGGGFQLQVIESDSLKGIENVIGSNHAET